ncbi:hypothetical protein Dimus_020086 [Dionaea muscipula]
MEMNDEEQQLIPLPIDHQSSFVEFVCWIGSLMERGGLCAIVRLECIVCLLTTPIARVVCLENHILPRTTPDILAQITIHPLLTKLIFWR